MKTRDLVLDMAYQCADRGPHPFLRAFRLAGGSLARLADETGEPEADLRWLWDQGGDYEPAEPLLRALFIAAGAQVLYRERELRARLTAEPAVADDPVFVEQALNLNEAHGVLFHRCLLSYGIHGANPLYVTRGAGHA